MYQPNLFQGLVSCQSNAHPHLLDAGFVPIRITSWYEWAKLYDRNQLVCVYPGEYESSTGCVKKPSGNVRCWCGGRRDCNNPETSRDIYEAFLAGDTEKLENIARWLKKPIVEEKVDPIEKALVDKLPGGTKPTRHPKGRIHSTRKTSTTDAATSTAPSVTSRMTTTRRPRQRITVKSSKQPPITATEASWSSTQPSTSSGKAIHRHKTTMSTKSSATTEDPLIKTQKNLELDNDKVMNMPTDDALQLDSTFEETRKKLQKDMREEEKRMAEYFADEDKEVALDEEDKTEDELFETAEDQRRKEREQYMKRRNRDDYERNLAEEEERLARMEREEERNHIKVFYSILQRKRRILGGR
ncbi:hypothetical protein WR25_20600 isoform C [Diploscapter pachys]|uniref:Uncharacterized protein n=1 Tax=Diploscapter pachys TaxID=2018661 RepID=A0A2A2K599_9BILA|nr:hypothetical protein WR25_20600 isoform C [Diploscapter pachys]